MNQTDIDQRLYILSRFAKEKNKEKYLQNCDETSIHTICELCFNIIRPEREMALNKRTVKKLLPIREFLHELARPRGSMKYKRLILSQISNQYPVISETIIPALKKKYRKKQKSRR